MKRYMEFKFVQIWIGLMITAMLGCASAPDIASTEKSEGETYSADQIRHITVDQPFLVSGEYFRQRNQEPAANLDALVAKKEKRPPKKPVEKKAAEQTDAVGQAQTGPVKTAFPIKVGFIYDYANIHPRTVLNPLSDQIMETATSRDVAIADQGKINEALAASDCMKNKDLLCVSRTLGLYPGVRMLVLIEALGVSGKTPAQASAKVSVVDTSLPFRYPLMEVTAEINSEKELNVFLADFCAKIFDYALLKRDMIPWHCRCFSNEDGKYYITAGEKSGLTAGQILRVMSEGKAVKSPTGMPAGWVPGKEKGRLRVDLFFGDDFSACSLVSGQAPGGDDLIMAGGD